MTIVKRELEIYESDVVPTTYDDNFSLGTIWIRKTFNEIYICVSNNINNATWLKLGS